MMAYCDLLNTCYPVKKKKGGGGQRRYQVQRRTTLTVEHSQPSLKIKRLHLAQKRLGGGLSTTPVGRCRREGLSTHGREHCEGLIKQDTGAAKALYWIRWPCYWIRWPCYYTTLTRLVTEGHDALVGAARGAVPVLAHVLHELEQHVGRVQSACVGTLQSEQESGRTQCKHIITWVARDGITPPHSQRRSDS